MAELAEFCNYGETLDKMLRDWLVWGVRDANIQKKLLGKSELNLMKGIQLAQSMEMAERNIREMEGGTPKDGGVNQVTRKNTQGQGNENGNCFVVEIRDTLVQPALSVSVFVTGARNEDI